MEPVYNALAAASSLSDAQLEGHPRPRSSLPFAPPLTIDPVGSDDEATGDSPSVGAKIRLRTRSLVSDANRVGLKAFSVQCSIKVEGTPARAVTTLDFPRGKGLKVEGATLIEELGPVLDAHHTFVDQFEDPKDDNILEFMEEACGIWDKKEKCFVGGVWNPDTETWCLPENPPFEKDIYPWMVKVITAIMNKFNKCPPGVEREVLDTHDVRFYHKDENYTSPDLVVRASGSSFSKPENGDIGYATIATFFDVKRERDMGNRDTHLKQLGTYVRYVR